MPLPTGTVTFLFTDIEGSTRLWEEHPEAMRQALIRHDRLIDDLVHQYAGTLVRPRGEGDSRFAVFSIAPDAVSAACAIQRALQSTAWPSPERLSVRMGLHTGEADLRDGDYYGSAVNRCARLRAIAHGGQVLLSETVRALAQHWLPNGVSLRDLGQHRLKDMQHLERLFQLVIAGLPSDFPPLRTLEVRPHILPLQ